MKRERGLRIAIRGRTEPEDDLPADDALLLTQRAPNDWWRDEFVMRALRGDFPDYPVFFKDDGSAIC